MALKPWMSVAGVLFLGGCGYVGPIVPPSPMVPNKVSDLSAVENGDKLVIKFTTPASTTDNADIRELKSIEMRVGTQVFEVPPPPPDPKDEIASHTIQRVLPAREWTGKHITVAVRTAVKGERFSEWSNVVRLDVHSPLIAPAVTAEATPEGYRLTWPAQGVDVSYDVFRQGPSDKSPQKLATTDKPEYVDNSTVWATPYQYTVQARAGSAESAISAPVAVNHPDTFPPAVPTDVNAVAGPESVEVSWQRSPDPDLRGYIVYRSENNSALTRQGDETPLPVFSDRGVHHGGTYRYQISAVDQAGNESAKSTPVDLTFP